MCLLSFGTVLVGVTLVAPEHTLCYKAFIAAMSEALLVAAIFQLNDVFDRKRDFYANTFKPVATGELGIRIVVISVIVLTLISFILAWWLGPYLLAMIIAQAIIGLLYYSRIKDWNGIIANFITAILFASSIGFGALIYGFTGIIYLVMLIVGVFVLGREIIKDIVDIDADSMVGLRTLPIIYGVDNSVMFGYGFIYIGLLGLLILNKSGNATAIALAAFAVIITTRSFLIARTAKSFDDFKLSLKWTAAAMVLGTLSIAFLY
jgi:4-hydroxybenzoate polyprenyltransferase